MGRAEAFSGYGFGFAEDNDSDGNRYTGRYQRLFIQPAIGIRHSIFDASLGVRLGFTHFSEYKCHNCSTPPESGLPNFSTYEPVLTVALGYKSVKFYVQYGALDVMSGEEDYAKVAEFLTGQAILNLGFTFSP